MKMGRGRTSRIRRRKLFRSSVSRGVNESYKPEFIELKKWLKDRKFEDTNLIPACFPGTGRGLMSKTSLQEGQVIISLPESCLLTTDTVIRSYLGAYIAKWRPPPSPLLALCTFLVSEKHAGDQSVWKPYLEILPKAYTCPVCLEPEVVNLFPKPLRAKAEEQRARVREFFSSSRGFFSSLQPLFSEAVGSIFSYRALLWAWCTVNTRAVYVKPRRRRCFSAEPDTCALAPYLDLLNHSPRVQVEAAFNEETRCYEIRTASSCRKHEEVFICYGPHDNQRLLLEYGFVSIHNPHACVYVSEDILVKYLPSTDKQMNKKISILKDHDFIENLTFGWDGPSWRLLTALKLLCLEAEELPRDRDLAEVRRLTDCATQAPRGGLFFMELARVVFFPGDLHCLEEIFLKNASSLFRGKPLSTEFSPGDKSLLGELYPPWGQIQTPTKREAFPWGRRVEEPRCRHTSWFGSLTLPSGCQSLPQHGKDCPLIWLRVAWSRQLLQPGSTTWQKLSTCWKKILLGEIISDTNEKRSLDIAQKICHYFIEETNAVLQKVSHMKDEEVASVNQLTLVETLWTEELKILQASALILNSLQTPFRKVQSLPI
ncbi:SET domain-containing protein 4 isoform X4 [Prionailurus viverrinus]|uniref:SET domain-containing protein 4 isoform X4 n=1 Tax=Prionailurus viverrinus TaxID=61388 RepID=UPI001FF14D02|nr:SET domain-containing protein 4 isoform X4 [Prionailurus viverrinus]